jgi:hypothetical protein
MVPHRVHQSGKSSDERIGGLFEGGCSFRETARHGFLSMPCQLYRMKKERGYPGGIHEQPRWKCAAYPRKVLWAMSKQVSVKWIYPSICISSCSMCRSTFQPTLVGSTSGLFSSWCLLCLLGDRFLSKRFLQVYTNSLDLLSLTVLVRWASLDKLVLARWVRILLHARARARWACPFPGFLFVSLWTLDAPGGPVSFGHVCLAWCVDLCSLCGSTGGPALYRCDRCSLAQATLTTLDHHGRLSFSF